jgi:hypothetical protein
MNASSLHRPSPWIAFGALVLAPVVSAIVSELVGLVLGYETSFSPQDLGIVATGFGVLFLVLGAPLIVVFWKRAPFGARSCSSVGAACGALVGSFALKFVEPSDYAWIEGGAQFEFYLGATIIIAHGLVAGLAGGMAFWLVCRLASRAT